MDVKAIYKIPNVRHAFIIVSSLDEISEDIASNQESKTRMEYFERILRSKDCKVPIEAQRWTLKVLSHKDFVSVVKRHYPKGRVLSNQTSFDDPESLELLAINLTKTESGLERKELCFTDQEDVIEVFI